MKFKAVIFDFDGLMFDTEKIWKIYFLKANDVFNVDFTEEDRIQTIGKNETMIRQGLKELNKSVDIDKYRDWLRKNVYSHYEKLPVPNKNGLYEILDFLKFQK